MQAPPESLPAPSSCDWCLYPLILCPYHSSELVLHGEPSDPLWFYNKVINLNSADTVETFQQIVEPVYGEPCPSSLYNEVTDGIDSADEYMGESSSAEMFRPIVASEELVAASNRRRTTGLARFTCDLCLKTFTAKHNLQSTSPSAPSIFVATDPFTRP